MILIFLLSPHTLHPDCTSHIRVYVLTHVVYRCKVVIKESSWNYTWFLGLNAWLVSPPECPLTISSLFAFIPGPAGSFSNRVSDAPSCALHNSDSIPHSYFIFIFFFFSLPSFFHSGGECNPGEDQYTLFTSVCWGSYKSEASYITNIFILVSRYFIFPFQIITCLYSVFECKWFYYLSVLQLITKWEANKRLVFISMCIIN